MRFELDVTKHFRPVHQCERVDCDNYIYGAVPHRDAKPTLRYECDECGEQYSIWTKNWPKKDVRFIIS